MHMYRHGASVILTTPFAAAKAAKLMRLYVLPIGLPYATRKIEKAARFRPLSSFFFNSTQRFWEEGFVENL